LDCAKVAYLEYVESGELRADVAVTKHRIGHVDDIRPGQLLYVEVADIRICLARVTNSGYYAIGARCTHEDELLTDGELHGDEVECAAHGSRFSVITGEVRGLPATAPANVYSVTVVGADVFVEV
jgi:nitrite reductase/ring-hydroxylating ferredoxin subunit